LPFSFNILIVEDDDDTRHNLEDILGLDGYIVRSVSRCSHALNEIETGAFDAAIIDWHLPDGSGGDLISIISKHQGDTPVIVVTGVRDFETPVKALVNGAYDFLSKPINPDVLRASLGRLVERKKHLTEIEHSRMRLLQNERLAAIGQMVSGLAHESRNAFQRSHACLAELSLDLQDKPESLQLVQKVQKALDDLHRLLEEVRCYSAPIVLEKRSCDLAKLIAQCWQQILDAGQMQKQPHFEVISDDDFPNPVPVDPDKLCQVVSNLLENALHACAQPGKILIELSSVSKNNKLRIAVSDDGPGVPKKNHQQIFEPFFTTKTKGTGLGLAISARIVEAHGGKLLMEDSPLGGARFVVELNAGGYGKQA
jgi:signal transduction histidine kinase